MKLNLGTPVGVPGYRLRVSLRFRCSGRRWDNLRENLMGDLWNSVWFSRSRTMWENLWERI